MSNTPDDEREQTDQALRAERAEADNKLRDAHSTLEVEANATLEEARLRADALLARARALADTKVTESSVRRTMAEERATEDATLETERAAADGRLSAERLAHARVLADILRHERGETDRHLDTEREQMDVALETRDDFLAMVAHDLRTLLGGMAMSAASLKTIAADDETRMRVNREAARLERFTARMTRLVGDLTDVVSIEAGKLHLDATPHEANSLIRDTLEAFEHVATLRGVTLDARVGSGSLLAEFDRERVLQVLANLVSNAIKFSREGETVSIRIEPIGREIRFTVTDTGAGIPAEKVTAIFERYWQVASYDRRGLGLGLYISKRIVEAHGGRIWVESAVSQGSRFFFTLPRRPPPPS